MDSEELDQTSVRQPDSTDVKNHRSETGGLFLTDRDSTIGLGNAHVTTDHRPAESLDLKSGRTRFEQYLHDQPQKDMWRYYLKLREEAKARKRDPMEYLFEKLERHPNPETAKKVARLRMKFIGRRVLAPTEKDVLYLKKILDSSGVSLEGLCTILSDRKRIADLIVALKLDQLSGVELDSIYFTVDRIVTTAEHKGTSIPVGGQIQKAFREKRALEKALKDKDVIELLFGFKSEEYLSRFQKDFSQAEKELQAEIADAGSNERALLEHVLSYYRKLREYSIPGIVEYAEDKETKERIPFPALHQKIFVQFLLDKKRAALFDDMGLGKTASAIIAKNALEAQIGRKLTAVVIAPNEQVADHWEEEINKWNTTKQSIVRIKAENKETQLAQIRKGETDFVITTYDLIFRAVNGCTVGDKLKEFAEYSIFDEVHKAKEENAKRTQEVLNISSTSEYVVLMSGTPMPNRLDDLGVIASILKKGTPDEITPKEFCERYKKYPRTVRTTLLPHMLRRLNENVYGARNEELIFVPVQMSEKQAQAHLDIDMNEAGLGALQLIQQLRRCSLDPRLVGVQEPSPKYTKLRELVVGEVMQGRKVLVYSSELKEGVLDKVVEELGSEALIVSKVSGDVQGKKRDAEIDSLVNGNADAMAATLETMGEGIDKLTVASSEVFLDVPFTHSALIQGIRRVSRKGQKDKVRVYMLISVNPGTDPKEWEQDNTVDVRLWGVICSKRRLEKIVIDGMELTDAEKAALEDSHHERFFGSNNDPINVMYRFFGAIKNRSTNAIAKIFQDVKKAEYLAKNYFESFEGSFYGNVNDMVRQVIQTLERMIGALDKKLDIASGPMCLARTLRDGSVTSFDINEQALLYGKEQLSKPPYSLSPLPFNSGSFTALPYAQDSFDLSVLSLGLLYSSIHERESVVREMLRVTKIGQPYIFVLPSNVSNIEGFMQGLERLGAPIIEDLTGLVTSPGTSFEANIVTGIKMGNAPVDPIGEQYFSLDTVSHQTGSLGTGAERKRLVRSLDKFEIDGETPEKAMEKIQSRTKRLATENSLAEAKKQAIAEYGSEENAPQSLFWSLGIVRAIGRRAEDRRTCVCSVCVPSFWSEDYKSIYEVPPAELERFGLSISKKLGENKERIIYQDLTKQSTRPTVQSSDIILHLKKRIQEHAGRTRMRQGT